MDSPLFGLEPDEERRSNEDVAAVGLGRRPGPGPCLPTANPCEVCGHPLDTALANLGETTHPTCASDLGRGVEHLARWLVRSHDRGSSGAEVKGSSPR
jgi:hypothetical protein